MKTVNLICIISFLSVDLSAQEIYDYRPFAEQGKVWNMKYQHVFAEEFPSYEYNYYIDGDTVIGDHKCKKLYARNEGNSNQIDFQMSLWEDGRKVYFIPRGMDESFLLYDFSLNVGEKSTVYMPVSVIRPIGVVKEMERVVYVGGTERRCSLIRAYWNDSNTYSSAGWWIEGIGCELGPFNTCGFEAVGNLHFPTTCEVGQCCVFDYKTQYKDVFHPQKTNYKAFIQAGKVWKVGGYVPDEETPLWVREFYFDSEYTSDNQYMRLMSCVDGKIQYEGLCFEEDQRVYFIPDGETVPQLLYSFNTQVGDVIALTKTDCIVDYVLDVNVAGRELHCSVFRESHNAASSTSLIEQDVDLRNVWIEGVGSIFSPLTNVCPAEGLTERLLECTVNGETIYTDESNPVEELTHILFNNQHDCIHFPIANSKSSNGKYYDLSGRRLSAPPAKGVYIENGKKRVTR